MSRARYIFYGHFTIFMGDTFVDTNITVTHGKNYLLKHVKIGSDKDMKTISV